MKSQIELQQWAAWKLGIPVREAPTKALSLRQPWAWLMLHGKDVENRKWRSYMTGWVFIHASKGMTYQEYDDVLTFLAEKEIRLDRQPPEFHGFDLGGIIGAMKIAPAERDSKSVWFFGPWGIPVSEVKALPFLPCRGMLNYFTPQIEQLP